ncbi:MAG: GNAT family N-acetyltransferase [Chloroflexota bacterium]|jgi:RimJ/RimL family protein N-acetyltransferase
MLHELPASEFERVRPLFSVFDHKLSIAAAIEGNNPGRFFVDDIARPRLALALTVEGYILSGIPNDLTINAALSRFLRQKIFTGQVYVGGDSYMSLAVYPEAWEARLPELIPTHEVEKIESYHYLCREVGLDWRRQLPAGYTIRRFDRAMLDDPEIVFPAPLNEWRDFESNWWSVENFLVKGASCCVLYGSEVVSWCASDCSAGDRTEVGIITHPAHRRRGLAAVAGAATVEYCLERGFSAVGWHCSADNTPSWKTAEKAGFRRERSYWDYYYVYDPVDHLAELGWYHYKQGNYARTVDYYARVFAQRQDNPDYYYHLAASASALLGDGERALLYLQRAADQGWSRADYTRRQEEFGILHGREEWEAILAQMAGEG